MNIYVLLKRTFDTEEKITLSGGKINEDGAEFIINPYDEYAVEEAIQYAMRKVEKLQLFQLVTKNPKSNCVQL